MVAGIERSANHSRAVEFVRPLSCVFFEIRGKALTEFPWALSSHHKRISDCRKLCLKSRNTTCQSLTTLDNVKFVRWRVVSVCERWASPSTTFNRPRVSHYAGRHNYESMPDSPASCGNVPVRYLLPLECGPGLRRIHSVFGFDIFSQLAGLS